MEQIDHKYMNHHILTEMQGQMKGFPGGLVSKESTCNVGGYLQFRRPGFDPGVEKIPWRREWQSTPVCLPGKSREQRSLVGYSLRGHMS